MNEFRILGPLDVRDARGPVELTAGKQRAVLADLLLHADRVVSVERLVDDLWGEDVPETAVKSLQVHVSKLRRALPGAKIETKPPGYMLRLDGDELDLVVFERLAASGRGALAEQRPEEASDQLAQALGLWRGRALADVDEPFAAGASARLDELRLSALEDRFDAELHLGRHALTVAEIEAAAAEQPFRERLQEQLLLALYRAGRQAAALECFQRLRRQLRDELGIVPSERLRELERRILNQDPALQPTVALSRQQRRSAERVPRPAETQATIVGRQVELAHLADALADALAGSRRVVFVTGEPGAGKTTLVEGFLASADLPEEGRVAHGQCIEHRGAGEPYLPMLDALGRLCRDRERPDVVECLRSLAPTWLAQLPALVAPEEEEQLRTRILGSTRERMLREMVELLEVVAARAPLVLVLEDLHWSDVSTLDLLDAIARRRDPAQLLVVGTYRSPDPAPGASAPRKLARDLRIRGLCVEIGVGGLTPDDVAAYVDTRLPSLDTPELAGLLHTRTHGNPLFIEKLVEAWVAGGGVTESADGWRQIAPLEELARDVPATLRALIAQRLEGLGDEARDALEAASIVGATFATATVAAASGRDEAAVDAICEALARDQLFVAPAGATTWPDGRSSALYGFTHDLCLEVLAESVPPARRKRMHRRVAEYLSSVSGQHVDHLAVVIAWHAVNGDDHARAVEHLARSAQLALERNAFRESRSHLENALQTLAVMVTGPATDQLELRVQALAGAVEVALDGWDSAAAEAAYSRARELAARLGAADELAVILLRLATLYEFRGEYPWAEALLEETLRLPTGEETRTRQMYVHELLACTNFHMGAHEASVRHAETALSFFDGTVDPLAASAGESPAVSCNSWASLALWHLGLADQALDRAERALSAASLGIGRNGRAMGYAQAAVVALFRGELERADCWAAEAIDAAIELGFPYWQAVAIVVRGYVRARLSDAPAGLAAISEGIELARATGARMDEPFFLGLLADAALHAGRVDEAADALCRAGVGAADRRSFFFEPELLRLDALVRARRGDLTEARCGLRRAADAARRLGSLALELRAAVSDAALEAELTPTTREARSTLASLVGRLTEGAGTADVVEARGLLTE